MNYQHISTKQVAEYIKQDLEKEIPQVDFQVSTNGNTLDIRYVDGVAKEQVEEIVNRYDSRTYSGRHKGLSAKDLKPIQVGDKLVISEVQLFFVCRRFSVSYLQQVYDYLVNTYDLEPEVTIKVSTQDGAGMITGYGLDGHILIKQVADRGTYKYRGYTLRFGTSYEEIVDRFLDSSEPVDLRAYGIEPWGECYATYEQVKAKLLPIRVLIQKSGWEGVKTLVYKWRKSDNPCIREHAKSFDLRGKRMDLWQELVIKCSFFAVGYTGFIHAHETVFRDESGSYRTSLLKGLYPAGNSATAKSRARQCFLVTQDIPLIALEV